MSENRGDQHVAFSDGHAGDTEIVAGLRRIRSRRRRAMLLIFLTLAACVWIGDYVLGRFKFLAFLPVLVVVVRYVLWFSQTTCPRCGKSFFTSDKSLWSNALTHKCMNCGIPFKWRPECDSGVGAGPNLEERRLG